MRCRMSKAKINRCFECITDRQKWKIEASLNESVSYDRESLDELILSLTGVLSMDFLSKQEASFIIDALTGQVEPEQFQPWPPRTEEQIGTKAADLPTGYQINFIRESIGSLHWSVKYFNHWLEKRYKVESIRSLDRKAAKKVIVGLLKLRMR